MRQNVRVPGAHLAAVRDVAVVGAAGLRPTTAWAGEHLAAGERELWERMTAADRRHSIEVARRFVARRPAATHRRSPARCSTTSARSRPGWARSAASSPPSSGRATRRFRLYHDHEAIGARLAAAAGADPATVDLVAGHGAAAADLRAADDV